MSNPRAVEFLLFVCLRVAVLNPLHRSSRLCSSPLRLHHPCTGCLGQKTVCGRLRLSCRCAGAEEWAQPWRRKKRKRRLKEDRKKNAAASRTLTRRGKGTGCCLYGGQAALVSWPRRQALGFREGRETEVDSRLAPGSRLPAGV